MRLADGKKGIISEKIKELRKLNMLTQEEFATKCAISKSLVAGYEQSQRNPSRRQLYNICDTFGISPSYFNLSDVNPYKVNQNKSSLDLQERLIENQLNQIDELLKKIALLENINKDKN